MGTNPGEVQDVEPEAGERLFPESVIADCMAIAMEVAATQN
jgi:hypothetical protein